MSTEKSQHAEQSDFDDRNELALEKETVKDLAPTNTDDENAVRGGLAPVDTAPVR